MKPETRLEVYRIPGGEWAIKLYIEGTLVVGRLWTKTRYNWVRKAAAAAQAQRFSYGLRGIPVVVVDEDDDA